MKQKMDSPCVAAHSRGMKTYFTPRLLEVIVTPQEPALWKWHVSEANVELAHGYATSQQVAQSSGDRALFAILSVALSK
ncbi:hypothetical protein L6654_21190 [Bradyrhizobium sp. WYCCWR 13023]|uniref:Uncharacterized protein n=1 Tax=Bradyrhizobium zhengyangense TaxID=2911009 RepID=A0A9X1UBM4_9BRAD|nr:hypothetical protein [Bradyrhizobium zhengyangense]MCG2629158.1 hypothetical protein [Bradyrhizobium zhengyangense]MCG2640860.1 hypothetical protein [Bradyrhizobium zhengyangense]